MTETMCNLCGFSCALGCGGHRSNHGLVDAVVTGGYESTPGNGHGALDDLTRHRFNLCEFCLDWLFSQFVIPVAVDDPMNDHCLLPGETVEDALARGAEVIRVGGPTEEPPWRPAAERVKADDWRKQKDEFFAEAARRAIARARRTA